MVGLSKGAMRGPKLRKGPQTRKPNKSEGGLVTCQIWLQMEKGEIRKTKKKENEHVLNNRMKQQLLVET
jgi:hypothetical protein